MQVGDFVHVGSPSGTQNRDGQIVGGPITVFAAGGFVTAFQVDILDDQEPVVLQDIGAIRTLEGAETRSLLVDEDHLIPWPKLDPGTTLLPEFNLVVENSPWGVVFSQPVNGTPVPIAYFMSHEDATMYLHDVTGCPYVILPPQ